MQYFNKLNNHSACVTYNSSLLDVAIHIDIKYNQNKVYWKCISNWAKTHLNTPQNTRNYCKNTKLYRSIRDSEQNKSIHTKQSEADSWLPCWQSFWHWEKRCFLAHISSSTKKHYRIYLPSLSLMLVRRTDFKSSGDIYGHVVIILLEIPTAGMEDRQLPQQYFSLFWTKYHGFKEDIYG